MTFTYNTSDLTTNLAMVRTLIPDTDSTVQLLADEQIAVFLSLEGDDVRKATALALETIASNQVLVMKVMSLLDLQTDGAAVSRELRQRAGLLRDQSAAALATTDGEDGAIDYVEWVVDPASYRSRVRNQALRGAL